MSRSIATFLAALFILGGTAHAEGGLGVGMIVEGREAGLSAKKWLGGSAAIDLGASYSATGSETFQVHVDYVLHNFKLLRELAPRSARNRLAVYYGIGGGMKIQDLTTAGTSFENDVDLGIRFPVGITYLFKGAPLDVFFELVPTLDVHPNSEFRWRSAFGVRYYFK